MDMKLRLKMGSLPTWETGGNKTLSYAAGEIGAVDTTTVVIRFNRAVKATNAATGVTITKGGASQTISSGTIQADKRIIRYVITPAAAVGDALTFAYNGATGNIADDLTDEALATITATSITNNIQDTTAPTVTGFTLTTPINSLTIPITAFTATDAVGVTGYIITETSAAPASGAAGWAGTAPSTYVVSTGGSYTLYPWAKDAAGNVSAEFGSPRTVSVDVTAPVVTAFTVTTPTTSLDVEITAFTATDAVGVSGYLITETSTPPASNDAGWEGSAPATYAAAEEGTITLYPWAKDAAGNVSTVFGSPREVEVTAPNLPSVTAFDATTPSESLTIEITSFTGSATADEYLITASSVTPAVSNPGWNATPQTEYVTTADGTYNLYPWVKDADDNISAVTNYVTVVVGVPVTYLYSDEYTTDLTAGNVNNTNCEPGPGVRHLTDAETVIAITDGALTIPTQTANGYRGNFTQAIAHQAGIGIFTSVSGTNSEYSRQRIGSEWLDSTICNNERNYLADTAGGLGTVYTANSSPFVFGVVRSSSGIPIYIKDDKIVWVGQVPSTAAAGMTLTMYPLNLTCTYDDTHTVVLGAPWQADYGLVTQRRATNDANDAITQEADALIEWRFAAETGVTKELSIRRTDADNRWIVRCDQAGTVKLIERNAGTETERGTANVAQSNGTSYRVVAICDGSTIRVCFGAVNQPTEVRFSYATATLNATATSATASHSGTNLIAWPLYLSGASLRELAKVYPSIATGYSTVYADGTLSAVSHTYAPATRAATGGADHAYPTINQAIDAVDVAGTVYVRGDGETYRELHASGETCYRITKNMILAGYDTEVPILTYILANPPAWSGGDGSIIDVNTATQQPEIKNLHVFGLKARGWGFAGYPNNITISRGGAWVHDCTITDAKHCGVKFGGNAGVILIEKNDFYDIGLSLYDHGVYVGDGTNTATRTIRHNIFRGGLGYGVHLYGSPNNVDVYGNVFVNYGGGHNTETNWTRTEGGGIVVGGTGHKIYNNTFVGSYKEGIYIYGDSAITYNNIIANNISRGSGTYDLSYSTSHSAANTNTGYNNNFDATKVFGNAANYTGTDDVDVAPGFVDATPETWDDLRLDTGSPMIEGGRDMGAGYIAILDPASTTWPAAKNQGATRDIGAFTT